MRLFSLFFFFFCVCPHTHKHIHTNKHTCFYFLCVCVRARAHAYPITSKHLGRPLVLLHMGTVGHRQGGELASFAHGAVVAADEEATEGGELARLGVQVMGVELGG